MKNILPLILLAALSFNINLTAQAGNWSTVLSDPAIDVNDVSSI